MIRNATIKVIGFQPLLQSNPTTVDRFHPISKRMAAINARKTRRTDEDYLELRELEIKAKTYFDEKLGVYVPGSWLIESFGKHSHAMAKIPKAEIRGSMFVADKLKLVYSGMDRVKTLEDIVKNDEFHHLMNVKQGQVRVIKACPIFNDWSFETELEFDDKIVDKTDIDRIFKHAARLGGYGDFRPTFGRANVEITHG
jgi:hypothetical protein